MVRTKKTERQHSVDRLMLNVASALVRDFQDVSNDPCFCSDYLTRIREGNLNTIRETCPTVDFHSDDVWLTKARYQMQAIFKRYRFRNDTYSDAELEAQALDGFKQTQQRIREIDFNTLDSECQRVMYVARMYIARVLGEYSDEEHRNLCRFGRKASVGVPARKACEAERWSIPVSGSPEQISWFHAEMRDVPSVMEYWQKQLDSDPKGSIYRETSSLTLTLVPKTFKAFRSIMPNTTLGSYISYGLGEMIRKRLKREGYDIKSLQQRHRVLAQAASVHGMYVTADLSSASDSISVALVEKLLPPDWFEILNRTRIGTVSLPDGTSVESFTFCTMGIGYTFPLQTLIFLSLLFAIQAVHFGRLEWRRISVYGDDLIFHKALYSHVLRVFPQLGFIINVDKTFSDGGFRESCGGDYYRGVDVRPFQPRNGPANVGTRAYEAILYKFINGLLMRWSEYEIANTLNYLTHQIELVTGAAKLVPGNYPDDSGIKCPKLGHWEFLRAAHTAKPKHIGHGVFRFSYLRLKPDLREEDRHEPYLWLALGPATPVFDYSNTRVRSEAQESQTVRRINVVTGCASEREPILIWKEDGKRLSVRSKLSGRRLRRLVACVTVSHTGHYERQSGTSGFEDRR